MSTIQRIPVVIYAARSDRNTENEQTAQQIKEARAAVEREGGREIVAVFEEDGRSGWKGNRGPKLDAAMSAAVGLADEHPKVELWVWNSNRLARGSGRKNEARSLLEVYTDLKRRGVTLRSVSDDPYVTDGMLIGAADKLAHKYSEDLSANVTRGKDAQWARGEWVGGPIPDGYRSDDARGIEFDPEREALIAHAWKLALDGQAPAALARRLNAEGHRTKPTKANPDGGPWTRRRVQDLLSNAVYTGALVRWRGGSNEQRKPGHHRGYVTAEQFAAVARFAVRRDRAAAGRAAGGRPSRRFLLATLARCGQCGGPAYAVTSTYKRKDGHRRRSYMCGHVKHGTGLCTAPSVDAEAVDAAVLARLPEYKDAAAQWLRELGSDRGGAVRKAQAEVDRAEAAVSKLAAQIEKFEARYAMEDDPTSGEANTLLSVLTRLRGERDAAVADAERAADDLAAVERTIAGDGLTSAFAALSDALDTGATAAVAEANRMLRDHFDAFVLTADGGVPIWKVPVPGTVADALTRAEVDAELDAALAAYRVTHEHALIDPEHNGESFQKPSQVQHRIAFLPLRLAA